MTPEASAVRRRWPWVVLLGVSGAFWLLNVVHGVAHAFVPHTIAAEPGTIPQTAQTVAITADTSPVDAPTAVVRRRLGVYRIGFGGRLVRIRATS